MTATLVSDSPSSRHLPCLDGLRAVAVSMVIVTHFGYPALGGLGVSIFFVLSGFLITTLLLRELEATGTVSLQGFYARRSLRIFPAYYTFLAFSAAIDFHHGDPRIQPVIVPALFYYLNYYHAVHGHSEASIAHAWSLAVEEQFYLIWPLAFLWVTRWQRARLPLALLLTIGAVAVWRTVAYTFLSLGQSWAYDAFDCRCDALATGCLLAVLLRHPKVARALAAAARHRLLLVAVLPLIVWIEVVDDGRLRYSVGFTVNAILIAFVMSQLLARPQTLVGRLLESGPLRSIGKVSYGMYLYHVWGLTVGLHVAHSHGPLGLLVGYVATVGFALVSYYVIEKPFLNFKQRFATPTAAVAGAADPSGAVLR